MAQALISYTTTAGTYTFTATGRTEFGRKVDLDPAPETAKPQREIVNWSVKQEFAEHTLADNQARYAALKEALRTPEGTLLIQDELGGTIFNGAVRVVGHNLPEQWGTYLTEVAVQFRSINTNLALDACNATFTPAGGSLITLPNVASVREGARTERPVTNVDNRRETMFTVAMAGKVMADMTQNEATRRLALQAAKTTILSIRNCINGTLAFAGASNVVRVDEAAAVVSDLAEQLDWSISCSYRVFPEGSDVEVEYEVTVRNAEDRSETTTTVQGKVMAKTRGAAETRAGEILVQYATGGAVLLSDETKVTLLDNVDGDDGWLSLSFTFVFRTALDVVSWDLTVTTKDDLKTCDVLTTYSGKVTALNSSAALTQARALGDGKLPLRLNATETITTRSVAGSATIFIECSFSYEYQGKGAKIYAEVHAKTVTDTFGNCSETISGFVAAALESDALTTAATFLLSGRLLRSQEITTHDLEQVTDSVSQHIRVDFSYVYHAAHTAGSIQYTLDIDNDYEARTCTATYAGTAWGAAESDCDTLINSLISGESGDWLREKRTVAKDAAQSITALICKHFNIAFSRSLTAKSGEDILEAEVTSDITYSIGMPVFTNIPAGVPYLESNVYQSPADIRVSGRVAALTEASARAWAAGKRSLVNGAGYEELPPNVGVRTRYKPKSGTTILFYVANFQFSGRRSTLFLS